MNHYQALVAAELDVSVDAQVAAMAQAIAAQHGGASRAVLFYGSCLREKQLDGLMLDFYLIVSDYPSAYPKRWLAIANRLIPPNVFPFAYKGLAAKYAVLSEADFAALTKCEASTVSVWARFAQPTRLVWVADNAARMIAVSAVADSGPTLFSLAMPLVDGDEPVAIWRAGFAQTYRAELRAERTDRSGSIVDSDEPRYRLFGQALLDDGVTGFADRATAKRRWSRLQRNGKRASVVRLAKASLTFAGGIDYLAWKINRHAGTQIEIKPWQRRWPLLGALTLLPKLLSQGAVR
ncbi:MAG: hypothetical protein AABY88_11725 [Pseudomonadota bacterium]